jgi:L-cystine uptake protein TcyP (sodium:dicarboxylate symporter family)
LKDSSKKLIAFVHKTVALLFLIVIALIPFAIVVFAPRQGGLFVSGYVTGMITVPLVAIGVMRAFYTLTGSAEAEIFGVFVFGLCLTAISIAAVIWSLI